MVHPASSCQTLQELIEGNSDDRSFQAHLAEHPWIFGSEYSELEQRRKWTRDEQADFMLRRTADRYLGLIEIKTPLGGLPLFVKGLSHHIFSPRSEFCGDLGQVFRYLEKLDAARASIKLDDDEDDQKVCAKVILGRDGNTEQVTALRRLNGHLHRVEVLTYDQLLRIGAQVVKVLERGLPAAPETERARPGETG